MATQTLSTADALLKDLYRGPIIEQINYKTYMLDMIERDSESVDFTGRRAIFPVHSAPNFSPTSISDGGTLPTPGIQGYQDGIVAMRYHSAALELTDMAVKQATGNEGSFVNLLQNDSKKLAMDLKKNINRQIFGDGTGLICSLTSGTSTTVFVVDSTQYLRVGSVIDVLVRSTGAATSGGASAVISAINRSTKTITVSAALAGTPDNTYGVYLPGARNIEIDAGLRAVAATSRSLHSINSATAGNEFWNGNTRSASGATAGESLFEQLADDVGANGQGEVDTFLTTRGIRRRLADTYQSTKRFVDAKAVEVHGGYQAIFVNEVPVIADDDVPKGFAFALRKDAFKWFQVSDPDWLKAEDASVWHLASGSTAGTNKAAWRAYFQWYSALGALAPNQVGSITSAADDAAVNY